MVTIYISEKAATQYQNSQTIESGYRGKLEDGIKKELEIISVINQFFTVIQVIIMILMFKKMGRTFLLRYYTWFDLLFYIFNTMVMTRIINPDPSMRLQRIYETFAIIFFLLKTLYFLKLSDRIAPMISIVFQIIYDIRFFCIIFGLAWFCFSVAFELQGKN